MAWHKILILGLAGSALAIGCTVTSDDTVDTDGGGSGGTSTGGTSSGGSATADSGSGGTSTGGTSAGGTPSTGGTTSTDAGPVACDPTAADNSACDACVQEKCCTDWQDCTTDECVAELGCMIDCTNTQFDAGAVDLNECAAQCATDVVLEINAEALVDCMQSADATSDAGATNCGIDCLNLDE